MSKWPNAQGFIDAAIKKNKIRYISHDEFEEFKNDPMFLYVGNYVYGKWKLIDGEVGIDGNSLERCVLNDH